MRGAAIAAGQLKARRLHIEFGDSRREGRLAHPSKVSADDFGGLGLVDQLAKVWAAQCDVALRVRTPTKLGLVLAASGGELWALQGRPAAVITRGVNMTSTEVS